MFFDTKILLFLLLISGSYLLKRAAPSSSFRATLASSLITPDDAEWLKAALKPDADSLSSKSKTSPSSLRVGIVGGGISGLYAALILDSLGYTNFEIHEANSNHLGGRAFTYHFNKNYQSAKTCAEFYDYGEMGPMRIPKKIGRVVGDQSWSLVNYLRAHPRVQKNKPALIKFYYSNDNTQYYYNGRRCFYSDEQRDDPLGFGDARNGGAGTAVPDVFTVKPFWEWIDLVERPFLDLMSTNASLAYEFLKRYDNHTVRSFMATFDAKTLLQEMGFSTEGYMSPIDPVSGERLDRQYPQIAINWMEALDTGTGLYDSALAETAIDAFDFTSNDWVTVDGGISNVF